MNNVTHSKELHQNFRSGFIVIAGAPNVGKSTLLNRVLGEKIAITSRKAQTTRNRILGVVHRPESQLIFLDTPGIHRAVTELNKRMVDTAFASLGGVDIILLMIDMSTPDNTSEDLIFERLKKQKQPVLLALNKVDLVKKSVMEGQLEKWKTLYDFHRIIPISARHGIGVDELLEIMEAILPFGPAYFPQDMLTDLPERFIAAEMVREKVFRWTGQEIPYSTAVTIESLKTNEHKNMMEIHAVIHAEHDSQKGILIGKGGSKLKQIGKEARHEIEQFFGCRVFLKLFVRVQKNWRKDTKALRKFGY